MDNAPGSSYLVDFFLPGYSLRTLLWQRHSSGRIMYPAGQMTFINLDRRTTLVENARLAGTSSERRQGLMGVDGFAEISGLWIIPCEAIHTFGMRMPIDSIFLDRKLRVRGLRSNLKPRRIAVCLLAHSVLELPAGTIEQSGTALGDCLSILREPTKP